MSLFKQPQTFEAPKASLEFHDKVGALLGSNYKNEFNSNPYLNYDYRLSLADRLGDLFGFRTGADKYAEDMGNRAREYDAQLMQIQTENEYNDPSAQAQRMRDAGMNPDLVGTESVENSSEFNQEALPASAPEAMNAVGAFFSNALVQGFDIAQRFMSLKGLKLDLDSKDLGVGALVESLGNDLALPLMSEEYMHDGNLDPDKSSDGFVAMANLSGYNKRNQKRIMHAISRAKYNYKNIAMLANLGNAASFDWTEWNKRKHSKLGLDITDNAMSEFLSGYVDIIDNLEFYNKRNSYYYEKESDKLQNSEKLANAESAEYNERYKSANFRTEVLKPIRNMIHRFSQADDPLSQSFGMAMAIELMRLGFIGK